MTPEYIPPYCAGNESEFYQLPSLQRMLNDLRLCGGDTDLFLKRHIKDRDHRSEVLHRFMSLLEEDEKAKEEFEDIRDGARRVALLKAEENMLKMAKLGGKNSFEATHLLLTQFNDRWAKRNAPTPQQEQEKAASSLTQRLRDADA